MIEVGASAAVGANTGSVNLDRTVYPVPFGEPRDFIKVGALEDELRAAQDANEHLEELESLQDAIKPVIDEEIVTPEEYADEIARSDMASLLDDVFARNWDDIEDNLDDMIQEAEDEIDNMRSVSDIATRAGSRRD